MLTVLLPTLGERNHLLNRAIQSVKDQTCPCTLIIKQDVDRIGAGPMLNSMLPLVETPWVHTMGDDDTLHPEFAQRVAEQDQAADMLVFRMEYVGGWYLPRTTNPAELAFGEVGCSYVTKTEVARRHGWMTEPCHGMLAEDWEMIQTVRASGGDIRVIPEVLYYVNPE